jgi:hypothetical protein
MKFDAESLVQKDLHYAIVDEVDSILIDEARTPLIISGPAEKSTHLYYQVNNIIPRLKDEVDYTKDEKARSVALTEEGVAHAEKLLKTENLYDPGNIELLHHVNQALKAHTLFKRDVDYIVKEGRGHHRGRVHRPPHARPALQRRPAPGAGGQGKRPHRKRKPDPGHHHLPELLPHVRQAGRHDRYGRHRGGRIQEIYDLDVR